jgi:uncharacterized membrane protein required for colicin V production
MKTPKARPLRLRTQDEFRRHVAGFLGLALGFLALFLGIGVLGYHLIVGLGWIDSLLNASMILTGMGPVDQMPTDAAKVFASLYAIVSGAVYPVLTAVVLYPFVHRMLSVLHLQAVASADQGGSDDA